MENFVTRTIEELMGRAGGPFHLRLILQPLMAAFIAWRAGARDAREGRTPFGWTVAGGSVKRSALVREAWANVGKLFLVAVILDVAYSLIDLHRIVPLQTLIVAITLALVPYLLIRAIAIRLAIRAREKRSGEAERTGVVDRSN
jgi:hypothetical protein